MSRAPGHCACGATLGPRNKSGVCKSCHGRAMATRMAHDPVLQERRRAAVAKHFEDPENRARRAASLIRRNSRDVPEAERQRRAECGRELHRRYLATPEGKAKVNSSESRAKRGKTRSDRVLAWCPPELRDAYRELNCRKHYTAAEARAIIEAQIPGTQAHAQRKFANTIDAMRIKQARQKAQEY
jgi:hypothetical protein